MTYSSDATFSRIPLPSRGWGTVSTPAVHGQPSPAGCPHPNGLDGPFPQTIRPPASVESTSTRRQVDPAAAEEFLALYEGENPGARPIRSRIEEVRAQIERYGTYVHTAAELTFGARVAWRNSSRCIGRLYWSSLRVRDRRHVIAAEQVAVEAFAHLREATNGGRVRPTVTVFAPSTPERPGPRIWNEQLIRYAGYRRPDGTVIGDPRYADFTSALLDLGWPGGPGTPLRRAAAGRAGSRRAPRGCSTFPATPCSRCRSATPATDGSPTLGCAGTPYPPSPTCAWRSAGSATRPHPSTAGTWAPRSAPATSPTPTATTCCRGRRAAGARHRNDRSLWRDRALVELNLAVLHSFDLAGVTIADHHTESRRFLTHLAREERAGRITPADWSWIVPPISGAATAVFHRYYHTADLRPSYVLHQHATSTLPWLGGIPAGNSSVASEQPD